MPAKWTQVPLDPAKLKPFIAANPGLGLDPDKPLPSKFQAYDLAGSGSNVNVVVNPSQGATLGDLEKEYVKALTSALKAADVAVMRVQIPGGPALRGSYRAPFNMAGGKTVMVTAVQYVLIRDDTQYILTVSTFNGGGSAGLADKIGRTLYLL